MQQRVSIMRLGAIIMHWNGLICLEVTSWEFPYFYQPRQIYKLLHIDNNVVVVDNKVWLWNQMLAYLVVCLHPV